MFYFDFLIYQCVIPFLLAFGAIALSFICSRPPVKMCPIKVAVPIATGLVVFILLWSSLEAIQTGRYFLFISKAFGLAGMATAFIYRTHLTVNTIRQTKENSLSTGKCRDCLAHQRTIWGPLPTYPASLFRLDQKNGISLYECQSCGGQWIHYAFAPEKKFPYLVKWSFGTRTWSQLRKVDRGIPILNWASIEIKRCFTKLSGEEALQVELHRKCTQFQNNPVDAHVPPPSFMEMPA